jgi:hypothetical protein
LTDYIKINQHSANLAKIQAIDPTPASAKQFLNLPKSGPGSCRASTDWLGSEELRRNHYLWTSQSGGASSLMLLVGVVSAASFSGLREPGAAALRWQFEASAGTTSPVHGVFVSANSA